MLWEPIVCSQCQLHEGQESETSPTPLSSRTWLRTEALWAMSPGPSQERSGMPVGVPPAISREKYQRESEIICMLLNDPIMKPTPKKSILKFSLVVWFKPKVTDVFRGLDRIEIKTRYSTVKGRLVSLNDRATWERPFVAFVYTLYRCLESICFSKPPQALWTVSVSPRNEREHKHFSCFLNKRNKKFWATKVKAQSATWLMWFSVWKHASLRKP